MALKPPTGGTASAQSLESLVTALQGSVSTLQADVADIVADVAGALTDITTLEGAVAALQALPGIELAGNVNIATSQARSNTAYGLLTTPDRVPNVVMPPNGLIQVAYQATWKESVQGAARAALFVGANQLRYQTADAGNASGPILEEALINNASAVNVDKILATSPYGLLSLTNKASVSAYAGDVTTGQVIGGGSLFDSGGADTQSYYGICTLFAAAGTYDISVQFKAASGSVTAKDRKLWVWTIG